MTSLLKSGKNTLELTFLSAFRRGRQLEEEQLGKGKHSPAWNGDASRLFVRKAQYNYGWDWGPVLMTGVLTFIAPCDCLELISYCSGTLETDWTRNLHCSDLRLVSV